MPGVAGVSVALSGVLERLAPSCGESCSDARAGAPGDPSASLREKSNTPANRRPADASNNPLDLTDAEKTQVRELKARDTEVHRHERAHTAAGGPYAGLPSYTYTRGPDGQQYATDGEVKIDTSPAQTPEATIQKMEVVIRAALAPAQPSAQDHAVANKARQIKTEAISEKHEQEAAEEDSGSGSGPTPVSSAGSAAALYQQVARDTTGALATGSAGQAVQLVV